MGHLAAAGVVNPPAAGVPLAADLRLALLPAATVPPAVALLAADLPVVGVLRVAALLAAALLVVGVLRVAALLAAALPVAHRPAAMDLPAAHRPAATVPRVVALPVAVATDLRSMFLPVVALRLAAEGLHRRPTNPARLRPVAVAPASKQARPWASVGTP